MTARPRSPKTRGTKGPKNGRHRTGVLLERVYDQMQVVLERLDDTAKRSEVATQIENLGGRMGLFEDVLRQTRKEVAARFDGVDRRFDDVDKRFGDVDRRFDDVDKRFGDVDKRFGDVDKRFDDVDKRFDDVNQELRAVRQDVARQAQGSELKALEQRMTVVERHLGL